MQADQNYLNWYFGNVWKGTTHEYIYSGWALVDKVLPEDWVLDVGCGFNPYKGKIKNLVGIDPANDAADVKVSIEDYEPDRQFDVAFCLGSIGFGKDRSVIERQIAKIVSCLKPQSRIYWRCNPGLNDHQNIEFEEVPVYPWTFEDLNKFAEQFGYTVKNAAMDRNKRNQRLYAEWHRA